MRIKKNKKTANIIIVMMIMILVGILCYSIFNIVRWKLDNNKIKEQEKIINDIVVIEEVINDDKIEVVEQEKKVPEVNPYWEYIKMNLISVNFDDLKKINNQVKGWIQVNGTNINYPFVQTNDNSYYLTHSFNKSYNQAGWIFMDYRNDSQQFNNNTILYGHDRYDGSMFASLKNILSNTWYNNSNNHIIKLSTEHENTLWQVFSVYKIPTTSDYLEIDFSNDSEYNNFIDLISKRTAYNFNTSVTTSDKILTLSSCYNDNEKVVMHAKLIKRQIR